MLIYINKDYFWNSSRTEVNHARNKSDLFPWFLPDYPEILKNFRFFPDIFQEIKIPRFPSFGRHPDLRYNCSYLTWPLHILEFAEHAYEESYQ